MDTFNISEALNESVELSEVTSILIKVLSEVDKLLGSYSVDLFKMQQWHQQLNTSAEVAASQQNMERLIARQTTKEELVITELPAEEVDVQPLHKKTLHNMQKHLAKSLNKLLQQLHNVEEALNCAGTEQHQTIDENNTTCKRFDDIAIDENITVTSDENVFLVLTVIENVLVKFKKHINQNVTAITRIADLEEQLSNIKTVAMELQYERNTLQERLSEQTQRISTLQSKLEEQRLRAENLQRGSSHNLNLRMHELQTEVQTLREMLEVRNKQLNTLKLQLENSKVAISHLEAELLVHKQPDRVLVEKLSSELKQKNAEIEKLKNKIKNEMINKLSLPDLIETMLADKNEEVDTLKEQLETKEKALLAAHALKNEQQNKTEDTVIQSVTELDENDEEPDAVRRAIAAINTPISLQQADFPGFLQETQDISKAAVADLTHRRSADLSDFKAPLKAVNTFDNNNLQRTISGSTATPPIMPRKIHFNSNDESMHSTPTSNRDILEILQKENNGLKTQIKQLKQRLHLLSNNLELQQQQQHANDCHQEILQREQQCIADLRDIIKDNCRENEELLNKNEQLKQANAQHIERLDKMHKNLRNLKQNEMNYVNRIKDLEMQLLKVAEGEQVERDGLRKELLVLQQAHAKYKLASADSDKHKQQQLNEVQQQLREKDEQLQLLTTQLLQNAEKYEAEKKLIRQGAGDGGSAVKQFSVDEITEQLEQELDYSAQLDHKILQAIESDEENNLNYKSAEKNELDSKADSQQQTDDENFANERQLLNHIEALKAQVEIQRKQAKEWREELLLEKKQAQQSREQDVLVVETMRKRLQHALRKEEELHQQLDLRKKQIDSVQTQLKVMQQQEQMQKAAKASTTCQQTTDQLLSEVKSLNAQLQCERVQNAEQQRLSKHDKERTKEQCKSHIEYAEKLKKEVSICLRQKQMLQQQNEQMEQQLYALAHEVESSKRLQTALLEKEKRYMARFERQREEYAKLLQQLQESRAQLIATRTDLERMHQVHTAKENAQNALNRQDQIPSNLICKMNELNALLTKNTTENSQMVETVQSLNEERRWLQQKCEQLEAQLAGKTNLYDWEERCQQLLGRLVRVESQRKALVYQKRYLKMSLGAYENKQHQQLLQPEQLALAAKARRARLFKITVLTIIAIQRMKFLRNIWRNGKRVVAKSVFTIIHQK